MDRIFDPFFTTKDIGQGTGLGLAVAPPSPDYTITFSAPTATVIFSALWFAGVVASREKVYNRMIG